MEPLKIIDADGDELRISKAKKSETVFIETGSGMVQIDKSQALQIIAHLKQCFNF